MMGHGQEVASCMADVLVERLGSAAWEFAISQARSQDAHHVRMRLLWREIADKVAMALMFAPDVALGSSRRRVYAGR
jgi:hypothetical protein